MRKAWRLPVGSVFIDLEGDPLFEATVTKVGWNRWMYRYTFDHLTGEADRTNRQVQVLIDEGRMQLIRDHR